MWVLRFSHFAYGKSSPTDKRFKRQAGETNFRTHVWVSDRRLRNRLPHVQLFFFRKLQCGPVIKTGLGCCYAVASPSRERPNLRRPSSNREVIRSRQSEWPRSIIVEIGHSAFMCPDIKKDSKFYVPSSPCTRRCWSFLSLTL